MGDERLLRAYRMRKHTDFQKVYWRRCTAADEWLLVFAAANDLGHPRLGLSVSRKVGGAVLRNRWKRCIREAFRTAREQLPPLDLVVIPRSQEKPSTAPIRQSLVRLAARLARRCCVPKTES